jgi:phosphoenolpyruvate synthase/pyruvate phosphate dikinase
MRTESLLAARLLPMTERDCYIGREASSYVVRLRDLTSADAARVGGKNASLGELIQALRPAGVNVPPGFATTAQAYWDLLAANHLREPIEATVFQRRTRD